MDFLSLLPGIILGYLGFQITTHPRSIIWKNLNTKRKYKIKRFQLFPSVKIFIFGRTIHIHHWISASVILGLSFFITTGILELLFTKGLLIGAIIQGILTPSNTARKLVYRDTD